MPHNEEFDPFHLTTGLADDYDFEFTNVRFEADPAYVDNEGNMIPTLVVDIVTDDPDAGTIEGRKMSIGQGWEIKDRGAHVERNGSMESNFNKNTVLGKFLQAAFECDGGQDQMRSRWETTKLVPQQAAFWEGLKGHIKLIEDTFTIKGEKHTKDRETPTAIYGWGDDAEASAEAAPAKKAGAKKAPAKKAAAAKPAKKAAAAKAESNGSELSPYQQAMSDVEGKIVSQLKTIAADSNDAEEFVTRAYDEVEGIEDDEQIMLLVDNTDDPDTIWAKAVREWEEAQAANA